MKYSVHDKVVVITGSSMGIGKALANLLGHNRAKLVINARNEERLIATERELKDRGYDVFSFAGDITSEAECRNLIDATLRRFGRIDVLVNNAGVSMRGTIEQLSPEVISTVFKVNAIAPVMLTQMALPYIRKTKGSIVFISSLAGLRGLPFISVYSSAKMALTAIVEALQVEMYSSEIHIGLVYVGYTEIEQGKTAIGADGKPVSLQDRKGFFTETTDEVAKKIMSNIAKRKKKTIIGIPGKLYAFLVRYFPGLLALMIRNTYSKTKKLYE
jgi:short-subunit dehydrogenase